MKRIVDLLIASMLIVPATIIVMLVAFIIRIDSPGPAFFLQDRVGRHGRHFRLVKLRTMHRGTVNAASHEVSLLRVTRVGALFRRMKIDELPQLLCVLNGSMSLVGPRPCLPSQKELIKARSDRDVLSIRPGITGLAQLYGIDMSRPQLLAYVDGIYVQNCGLGMDVRILLNTIFGGGRGDAVKKW